LAEPAVIELVESEPDIEIVWKAFELRPAPAPLLQPDAEYLQRVWKSSVYPLAESLGVVMKLPPVQPRSRLAHEAAHWARTQEKFEEMNAAIFRALFERGENIGEQDVLVSLAFGLNLDGDSLRLSLENGEFTESVIADQEEAGRIGVSGVPAFVANRIFALSGVQPLENLKMLVERSREN
jgi:predicted DsbA family dithiol-disulfide isomerase